MEKFFHQKVDSTQDESKRLIDAETPSPFCVLTNEQSAGRGQYGKAWASPAGAGLYVTIVTGIRDWGLGTGDLDQFVSSFTSKVAEQVIEVLNEIHSADYYIKPINDIYYDSCKLAGILVEIYKDHLLIGIGINIKDCKRELREAIIEQPKAAPISLEEIMGDDFATLNKEALIEKLLIKIANA